MYRLYDGPGSRLMDMFGLLRAPGRFTEHAALDGVSLDIRRGEKVAFIGRNGAGKSTLLKLVTKVIEPTSGSLEVQGKVHALLQIGTGFHPDFTGRENVLAYLAQLGVTGRDAERKYAEIVEFAELEEYIGQPVKTYSSGMAVRLMFSTATAITPELLVLDEVLGVGDAYFAAKSYARIRELCAGAGTTLLLVTHDVYTAAKICDRMIWIDHGRVLVDDQPSRVIVAYEDSVRRQEERRLRVRRLGDRGDGSEVLLIEMRSVDARPLPSPVLFSRVVLSVEGAGVDSLPIGIPDTGTSRIEREAAAWGEATVWQDVPALPWNNYGSVFHKVAGSFNVSGLLSPQRPNAFAVDIDCWSDEPCEFDVRAFLGTTEWNLGRCRLPGRGWTHCSLSPVDASAPVTVSAQPGHGAGNGRVVITEIRTLDAAGRATALFSHRDSFTLSINYQVNDPALDEDVQVLVSFHRGGVDDACRLLCPSLRLSAAQRTGAIRVQLPELMLGVGRYTISAGITEAGYFDRPQTVFFSINPGMYDSVNRTAEIEVTGVGVIEAGTACVATGVWSVSE